MLGLGNPKWHHSSHWPRADDSRKKTTPNFSAMCGFTSTWTPCGLCCCLALFPEESQGFLLELRPGRAGLVPGVKVLACVPTAHAASWHHCQQPGTATARCRRELCVAVPAQPLLCATREPGRDLLVGWGRVGLAMEGPLEGMVATNTSSGTRVLCVWALQVFPGEEQPSPGCSSGAAPLCSPESVCCCACADKMLGVT